MTTRSRALLIVAGILIFAVVAPLAVSFAKGIRYNFETGTFEQTGVLVVRSDPRGADVILDGEELSKTPMTKRFLSPKQYDLEITKSGYHPWKTKTTIHPQLVSSAAAAGADRVFLLLQSVEPELVASSTARFYEGPDRVYFLKQTTRRASGPAVQLWEIGKSSTEPVLLSQQDIFLTAPELVEALGEEAIIRDQGQSWYLSRGEILPLPRTLKQIRLAPRPGTVLGLNAQNQLVHYDLEEKSMAAIAQQVLDFAVSQGEIYAITSQSGQIRLVQINSPQDNQVLFEGLPRSSAQQIFVSSNKQLFVLLDRVLYQVTDELKKINSEVGYVRLSDGSTSLTYGNQNESWLLSPLDGPSRLLTRSANQLGNAVYNPKTGYTIVRQNDTLLAVAAAGSQNSYPLATISPNDSYAVNPDGSQVIYQTGQNIYILKIR